MHPVFFSCSRMLSCGFPCLIIWKIRSLTGKFLDTLQMKSINKIKMLSCSEIHDVK